MGNRRETKGIWSVPFICIFLANLMLQMGQNMVNLLIPQYATFLGGDPVIVGVISSMFAVTALAIRPISGPAINSLNKKNLMLATCAVIGVAFFTFAVSEDIPLLVAGRLIHGIGIGFSSPLALAFVSEYLPGRAMASGIGIFSLGSALAVAVGPNVGLELSRRIGYPGTFAFGGAMVLVACLLCVFLPKGQQTAREPLKIKWSNVVAAEVTGPAIMMALLALPYMCINYYMAIYGEARGVEEIGLFFTAYAVALLVSRPIGGMVSDRFGFTASMIPGYALFALAFFLIASASTLPMFIVSGVITAFGYGTVFTNIQSLGMRNVRPSRRGVSANTLYAGMDAGTLLAGPFSGAVCEYFYGRHGDMALAYAGVYQVMVIPIVLGLLVYFLDIKRARPAYAEEAAENT